MRKAKKEEPEEYEVEKIVNHRISGRAVCMIYESSRISF